MTLQKPARTTDPVDALIRKSFRRRWTAKPWESNAGIDAEISRATGLTYDRVGEALYLHREYVNSA
jgi:hypothetical protein